MSDELDKPQSIRRQAGRARGTSSLVDESSADLDVQSVDAAAAAIEVPAYVRRESARPTASLEKLAKSSETSDFLLHLENRSLEIQLEKLSLEIDRNNFHVEKQRGRERIRMLLTLSILSAYLLSNIVLAGLVLSKLIGIDVAKDISSTFLTPILGLAGSAFGFYFGVSIYDDLRRPRRM